MMRPTQKRNFLAALAATGLLSLLAPHDAGAAPTPENGAVSAMLARSREVIHNFFYAKKVSISGLSADKEGEVRSLLPEDRSLFWWHLNRSTLGAKLSQLPRVESASIVPCADEWSVRCFEVRIQERAPSIVALVADHGWIVGKDGGFIEPLPQVRSAADVEAFIETSEKPLIGVVGLGDGEGGPELLRGRLRYVNGLIRAVEAEVGRAVRFITLETSGEAGVSFKGQNYPVRFGFSGPDLSKVSEEARRFKLLLSRLDKRDEVIKEVDVAFDKAAVVKLK